MPDDEAAVILDVHFIHVSDCCPLGALQHNSSSTTCTLCLRDERWLKAKAAHQVLAIMLLAFMRNGFREKGRMDLSIKDVVFERAAVVFDTSIPTR